MPNDQLKALREEIAELSTLDYSTKATLAQFPALVPAFLAALDRVEVLQDHWDEPDVSGCRSCSALARFNAALEEK